MKPFLKTGGDQNVGEKKEKTRDSLRTGGRYQCLIQI